MKKYKFNNKELLKNNILLLNTNLNDNIELLIKIIYNITKNTGIDNIENIYDNNIKFIINPDQKHIYKNILLQQSYSYFNKFSFTKSLNKKDKDNSLKQLYVIDYDYIKSDDNLLKIFYNFLSSKSDLDQCIFVGSNFKECSYLLKENLKKSGIIIHNIDVLKSLQRFFYKHIIDIFIKDPKIRDFDEYKSMLNHNNVNCIIITNGILRYI